MLTMPPMPSASPSRLVACALLVCAAAALAACSSEHQLISVVTLESCGAALDTEDGAPCDFDFTCVSMGYRPIAPRPCCTQLTTCDSAGNVTAALDCDAACRACESDAECPSGESLCLGGSCVPCAAAPVGSCESCDRGGQALLRNGCQLCDCWLR